MGIKTINSNKLENFLEANFKAIPSEESQTQKMTLLYFNILSLDLAKKLTQKHKNLAIEYVFLNAVFQGETLIGFKNTDFTDFSVFSEYSDNVLPHIAGTYSALCVLHVCGYDLTQTEKFKGIASYITKLQNEDGSIRAQEWETEADPRFCYCAAAIHALLDVNIEFDKEKMKTYLLSLVSYEGGFSMFENSEAHSGLTYCSVATLILLDYSIEVDFLYTLKPWVLSRMRPEGCNGRSAKEADCCYGFWNLATLSMLNGKDLIDKSYVKSFILSCQSENGGFTKFPGDGKNLSKDESDPLHTFYGLAGLSLCKFGGLKEFDPLLGVSK